MAQNNSNAGAIGTGCSRATRDKRRAATSPSSTFQLFTRQVLRHSTSPEAHSKLPSFEKQSVFSLSQTHSHRPSPLSSRQKSKSQLAQLPTLRRHLSKPPAANRLAKPRRRRRNLERAINSFLLRRQWWRRTRRPTLNMDFINHLRILQADEPSSDEESGRILTSAAVPARRRTTSPSQAPTPVATIPPAQPSETKAPAAAKRKREPPAEAATAEGTDAETAQAAKRARVQPPPPPTNSRKPSPPVVANGTKPAKKRAPAAEAPAGERVADRERARPTASTTSSKAAAAAAASPAAPPPPRKPVDEMEYFERRVHDMLTAPLDFDDCVFDSTRPVARHAARGFARNRRRQPQQPAPPLVMSGALGPAPVSVSTSGSSVKSAGGGGGGGGGARSKGSGSGSLAVEARKNAHREKVKERGLELKGRGKGKGKASMHGQGAVGRQPDGSKGRERKWLSNARQTGVNGGQRNSVGGKKYNKFA